MNQTIKDMVTRRSCRNFKQDPISRETLNSIIEAGLYAASGMGRQAAVIIAVTDRELRGRLSEANRRIGGWQEGFDPFFGAPAVLIVLGDTSVSTSVYDGSLVMGNLMLAAHSLGVGSCWIHRAKEEFETQEYKDLLKELGIDGEYEGIGHCILGYPAEELPEAAPRKENRVFYVE
ncbi:MAG: nitroreductase [Ruminococcus sp.]|nr:nitroreductase [Ruminococcus sp.]